MYTPMRRALSISNSKGLGPPPEFVSSFKSTLDQLTGQSAVLEAQQEITKKKQEFREWRDSVQEARKEYEEILLKQKHLHNRKSQVYQDRHRDLAAVQEVNREEEELLFQERKLHTQLEDCLEGERKMFERLSSAIQVSHDKERQHSQTMRTYSTLGSVLGALFGFLGSNMFLRREVKRSNLRQEECLQRMESRLHSFSSDQEKAMTDISSTISASIVHHMDDHKLKPRVGSDAEAAEKTVSRPLCAEEEEKEVTPSGANEQELGTGPVLVPADSTDSIGGAVAIALALFNTAQLLAFVINSVSR